MLIDFVGFQRLDPELIEVEDIHCAHEQSGFPKITYDPVALMFWNDFAGFENGCTNRWNINFTRQSD